MPIILRNFTGADITLSDANNIFIASGGTFSFEDTEDNRNLLKASSELRDQWLQNEIAILVEEPTPLDDIDINRLRIPFIGTGTYFSKDILIRQTTLDYYGFAEPDAPAIGERWLVLDIRKAYPPTGEWQGRRNHIAEWNGTSWDYEVPVQGWIVDITNGPSGFTPPFQVIYNGSDWAYITNEELEDVSGDIHPQYHNDTRGDLRYYLKTEWPNKTELDLVTDGDHDVRTDNPHVVTYTQAGAAPTVHTHVESDITDLVHAIVIPVRNESGGDLAKGTPVCISGWSGAASLPLVSAARADTIGNMPASGLIIDSSLVNNTNGTMLRAGTLDNTPTNLYTTGDFLYVAPTGGFTTTRPVGANLIQKVAQVIESDATSGSMTIMGMGKVNATGNLPDNNMWVGNTDSGLPVEEPYRGTSFPLSPYDGQEFYNITDKRKYAYDTTRAKWLSTNLFEHVYARDASVSNGSYLRIHNVSNTNAFNAIVHNLTIVSLTIAQSRSTVAGSTLNSSGIILSEQANDLVTFTINDNTLSVHDDTIDIDVNAIGVASTGFRARFDGQSGGATRLANTIFTVGYRLLG